MAVNEISKRAEVVRNWEDFLNKFGDLCSEDEYDEINNPKGYTNLGTAVNNMAMDIILPKLTDPKVWSCDTSLLQYREGYGIPRLRQALAAIMTQFLEAHQPVDPNDLFCAAGVTSCIDLIAHCLADPGEAILTPTPCYSCIRSDFMQRAQVKLLPIPVISEDTSESFPVLTLEKVKQAYETAKSQNQVVRAIFLINPSNPLGDIYSPELLLDIFAFCKENNLHVIVDEVYALSVFNEGTRFHSTLKFPSLPDKNKVHILYGISKDFGIAGLRIGVIHTRCKALQNCLKQLTYYQNIPFPMMDIAAKFIEDLDWCKNFVKENQRRLSEKYKFYCDQIEEIGLKIRKAEAGFFLWIDFRPICGSKYYEQERHFFEYLFNEMHLFIVPGEELFCRQPGWFRLTFTSHSNHVEEGLRRLKRAIKTYEPLPI